MIRYPHIAGRIFNQPLLIHPGKLDAIIAGLAPRFGMGEIPVSPEAYAAAGGEKRTPGYNVANGVAVLDIFGVLVHRSRMEADSSFLLGYDDIARRFEAALADPDARAVVLNMDSPGGEAAGCFDLAEQIRGARGRKPIHAAVSDLACSGCYALASACDDISITRTGVAGSVGVVMRHVDMSAFLDKEGVKVTHVFAGARKVDGNPYEPLPEAVRTRFQGQIDHLYGLFVSTVSANRGLDAQAVRDTEADIFMGQAAVDRGLADRVETPDQLISRLAAVYGSAGSRPVAGHHPQETRMSTDHPAPAVEFQPEPTFTQADIDAARAEGAREGSTAERTRCAVIMDHAAAEGRPALARRLALNTALDPETAAASVEGAVPEGSSQRIGNPTVADGVSEL